MSHDLTLFYQYPYLVLTVPEGTMHECRENGQKEVAMMCVRDIAGWTR